VQNCSQNCLWDKKKCSAPNPPPTRGLLPGSSWVYSPQTPILPTNNFWIGHCVHVVWLILANISRLVLLVFLRHCQDVILCDTFSVAVNWINYRIHVELHRYEEQFSTSNSRCMIPWHAIYIRLYSLTCIE